MNNSVDRHRFYNYGASIPGRDQLEKRIVGSVANIVVETTNLPCLLARPDKAE